MEMEGQTFAHRPLSGKLGIITGATRGEHFLRRAFEEVIKFSKDRSCNCTRSCKQRLLSAARIYKRLID
jgi:hypothetical protein